MIKRRKFQIAILALMIMLFSVTMAGAALFEIYADSGSSTVSDFTITFDDDGDALFELSELVSWTGMTLSNKYYFDVILGVPAIPNISITSYVEPPTELRWHFYSHDWTADTWLDWWTYSKSEVEVVPLPPAVWLLGSGLISIVGIRRKFKK